MNKKVTKAQIATTLVLLTAASVMQAQNDSQFQTSDWPMYRGNLAGTGFSELDQITTSNVGNLARQWRYSLAADPSVENARGPNSQATPIVVNGVMYLPAAGRVVAGLIAGGARQQG